MRRLLATPISLFVPLLTTAGGRTNHPSALTTLPPRIRPRVVPRRPAAAAAPPPPSRCALAFRGRAKSRTGTAGGARRHFGLGPAIARRPRGAARLDAGAGAASALASMNLNLALDLLPPTEAAIVDVQRVMADHIHPTMFQLQSLPEITANIRRFGETSFAALFLVAFVQGAVALYQYRTNPSGELVVPPGWTVGIEDASRGDDDDDDDDNDDDDDEKDEEGKEEEEKASTEPPKQVASLSTRADDNRPGTAGALDASYGNGGRSAVAAGSSSAPVSSDAALEVVPERGWTSSSRSYMEKGWYRVNRYLVVLIPWLARRWDVLLLRYGHLLHVGLIMSLASMFDFRRRKWRIEERFLAEVAASAPVGDHERLGETPNVVVIGDSMACGIGCVDAFDRAKNQTVAMGRIESLPPHGRRRPYSDSAATEAATAVAGGAGRVGGEGGMIAIRAPDAPIPSPPPLAAVESPGGGGAGIGPVFPRMLARTLSRRWNRPVSWRSAGVDGGTVDDIRRHCIGIVREEADRGRPPDVVVVLCGTNDVKRIFSGQWRTATAPWFRARLMELIRDVHRIAPGARVVIPALPTYRLDKNSIVNVFPLTLFLDTMLGFWDWQKKVVADCSPSNVLYVGLTAVDVYGWYRKEDDNDGDDEDESVADAADTTTLIAADGVHPNSRCYSHWAILVGNSLADALVHGSNDAAHRKIKQAKAKEKAS